MQAALEGSSEDAFTDGTDHRSPLSDLDIPDLYNLCDLFDTYDLCDLYDLYDL